MSGDNSDETLVARARLGDAVAFDELVRRYLRPAYVVALSIVLSPADAEDVAQESMVNALSELDKCRHPSRFSGWLLQGVRNRARNHLAWRRVRAAHSEEAEEIAQPAAAGLGLRTSLLNALRELAPVQREVVLLHDLEGLTHAEIALNLDTTETNSRQHLFQARRHLRELLRDDAPRKARHAT